MYQKSLLILLVLGLMVGPLQARPAHRELPVTDVTVLDSRPVKAITPDMEITAPSVNTNPIGRDEADQIEPLGNVGIGDDFHIGYTWYDYQHNGSNSKMIAKDSFGGVQFIWMMGMDSTSIERHVVYNYLNPPDADDGELLADPEGEPVTVDNADRSGYTCLSVLPTGREDPADCDLGVAYYHAVGYPDAPDDSWAGTANGVDFARGFGAFETTYPQSWQDVQLIWPKGAVDRQNVSHVLSCEYPAEEGQLWHRLGYMWGVPDEDFFEWYWPEAPIEVDISAVISQVVATSPTSNMVALGWHHSRIGVPEGAWVGGYYQRNSDVRCIVSDDGEEWDWDDGIQSITNIFPVRPELWETARDLAYGDTFRPYCDLDLQFDPWGEDELYASFATCVFLEFPEPDENNVPARIWRDGGPLWFWSSREDTLTFIFDGWYWNRTDNGGTWHSRCGGWRMNADRPSIAFNPDDEGTVYVVWTHFPIYQELNEDGTGFIYVDEEAARDTSMGGYSNAEIMISISDDWGVTWQEPINVTQTRWEDEDPPRPGECMSENWHSAAHIADDTLHIQYILDLDAGGIPQNEGVATNNPVIYHRVALADLDHNRDPVELPREGFMFHNYVRPVPTSLVREPGVPTPNEQVTITAEILAFGDQEIEEVELVYYINENLVAENSVAMEHVEDDIYEGVIPGQANGIQVWYIVRATNTEGVAGVGPTGWYHSYVVRDEGELTIRDIQRRPPEWAVDYSPYMGYEVTVEGVVTTPAVFNQQYDAYAIQDGEGDWSGLFVRGIGDDLSIDDIIRVTGTVMEQDPDDAENWEYATYIDVSDYSVLGYTDEPPEVTRVGVQYLVYSQRAEQLEGVLIRTYDFYIDQTDQADIDRGYWQIRDHEDNRAWFNTNGLTAAEMREAGLRQVDLEENDHFYWIQGVFTENFGHYAISVRSANDVQHGVDIEDPNSPFRFGLEEPYPNPFNASTQIGFELSKLGWAKLALYDLTGREIRNLMEGEMNAGHYDYPLDASSLANGVYLLQLKTETRSASCKIVLVK